MRGAGYGRIVLTSSIGGIYGNLRVANYGAAKAGIIGMSNVVALEGAEVGVACNVIVPRRPDQAGRGPGHLRLPADGAGARPHRRSAGSRTSPARSPARCWSRSPAGWRAPTSPETPGVYQPSWTIEDVAAQLDAIRDPAGSWVLPVVPSGHIDHITKSFAMTTESSGHGGYGP